MNARHTTTLALAVGASLALAGPQYTIPWSTIDGGGGTSSGGAYALSGTIGQPDASAPLSGGVYTLTGGFWAGLPEATSPACNDADLAEPFGVLDLADINAFVAAFTTQDPAGDIDGNGIFDLTDINLFVGAFLAGCP
jgi:hypothetical protein